MKLYAHQENLIKKNPSKCLIAHDTGTGKTITAINLAEKNCNTCLVICPKSIKEKWKNEIENYRQNVKFKVLTKEEFRKNWATLSSHESIIVDECHYFSSITSQMSKSLFNYLKKWNIKYRWLLSATPYMSTPWNIYTLAKHLGYNWSYIEFKKKFFYEINMGGRGIPVIKSGIEPEIQGLIYKIGDVVKLSDCIDMPDQIFEIENIELSKEQKKEIERIKQEEINPIVKYTKIHQAENGILIGDEYNPDKFFDNLKLERIAEYCEEKDKVVIFCRYNLQLKQIKEYLNKKFYALKIITINGKTKDRHLLIEIAELPQVKRCVCIINAACAEGYELPSFGTVIYASMSFSYVHNKQSQGRVMRINKPKKNLYVYLISGDLDKAVYKSFQAKKDFDVLEYSNEIRSGISDKIQPMVQEQG